MEDLIENGVLPNDFWDALHDHGNGRRFAAI
jgi:hypothetical protein